MRGKKSSPRSGSSPSSGEALSDENSLSHLWSDLERLIEIFQRSPSVSQNVLIDRIIHVRLSVKREDSIHVFVRLLDGMITELQSWYRMPCGIGIETKSQSRGHAGEACRVLCFHLLCDIDGP